MAKPPPSYGNLSLKPKVAEAPTKPEFDAASVRPNRPRPDEIRAEPTLIYMSEDAKKMLKRHVADNLGLKVHDILVEALEQWFERNGYKVEVRVPTERKRRVRG